MDDIYSKLPPAMQLAALLGVVIVVVYFGLNKVAKSLAKGDQQRDSDPFQYVTSTCDRMERSMGDRFDRIDRALIDINKDIIAVRQHTPRRGRPRA